MTCNDMNEIETLPTSKSVTCRLSKFLWNNIFLLLQWVCECMCNIVACGGSVWLANSAVLGKRVCLSKTRSFVFHVHGRKLNNFLAFFKCQQRRAIMHFIEEIGELSQFILFMWFEQLCLFIDIEMSCILIQFTKTRWIVQRWTRSIHSGHLKSLYLQMEFWTTIKKAAKKR